MAIAATCVFGIGLIPGVAWAKKPAKKAAKKAAKKKKFYKRGDLFIAATPFPTSAESDKGLVRKGRKHQRRSKLRHSGSSLRAQILLVLKRKFGGSKILFVLFKRGKKGYISFQEINVKKSMKRLVSWVQFDSEHLKRGGRYELRAVRTYKRGKRHYEKVYAKTWFKLR